MHAWLCSDLACVYDSQSSCVVLEEMVVLLHDKLFSESSLQVCMTIFLNLFSISISVDSRVANLISAMCHAWPSCYDLILHW